jgi:molybdopterin-biosynthesis enzyme MoeA-like protein
MCITFKNRKNKVCPYCRSKNIKVFRCIKESRVKEEIKELERTLKHLNASVVKKSVNVFLNRLEIKKVKKNGKTTCNSTKDN